MEYQGKVTNNQFEFWNASCWAFLMGEKIDEDHFQCIPPIGWDDIMYSFEHIRDIKNKIFEKHGAAFTTFQTMYECVKLFNANHHIKEMPNTREEFICVLGYAIEQTKK